MTIGGYNALISFNPLLTKLSTIDLLTNYALQQSQPSLTYNNSLASNTIVDSVSMIKSLNTYYSAFWKVFKSTIEEERSSFLFKNYSNVDFKLPIVMQATPALLGSLQKNSKGVFFDLLTMQKLNYFNMTNLTKLSDGFTYDFPFSLGFESDIIRYSWFDWYSVRNSIVTKAMDTSVFNLHGSKDYNYSFANNTTVNSINKTDNFFLRYLFARKLYIQSFTYNPFFLSTNFTGSFFNSYTSLLPLQSYEAFKFFNAKVSYFCMSQYSVEGGVLNQPLTRFNSLNSSTLSPLRAYIGSLDITANQTDLLTNLVDILSKKEYIIKSIDTDHFTYSMNKNYLLKSQASLKNPLILTLKAVFNSTELGSPRSTKTSNKIFFQAYNKFTPLNPLDSAQLSLKSQYQPLRKGIINMIRIQADKAVAMPTDTRLQILAVSKDIIHS